MSRSASSSETMPLTRAGGCPHVYAPTDWRCLICGTAAPKADGAVILAPELAAQNDGFKAGAFEDLAQVEAGNFWFEARNCLIRWLVRRTCPQMRSFLEIGCGTAFVLTMLKRHFPQVKFYGSEVFSAGLEHARRRLPDVDLFQMDARRMPFENAFDVIGAFDVLEHIDDDAAVLRNMHQALTPGGVALITVPQHAWLWSAADEYAEHKRRYTRCDLVEKLRAAGFTIAFASSYCALLLPLMLLSRLRQKRVDASYDPTAELRIAAPANAVLRGVLDVERLLMRAGLRYPAGGSLVVAGRKAVG